MAIRRSINQTVESVFRALADLVTEVSFVNGTVSEYTFGSADPEATVTTTTTTVEGIVTNRQRVPGDRPYEQVEILFRKPEVADIDVYDSATFSGDTWKIDSYDDNSFTITAILRKEV